MQGVSGGVEGGDGEAAVAEEARQTVAGGGVAEERAQDDVRGRGPAAEAELDGVEAEGGGVVERRFEREGAEAVGVEADLYRQFFQSTVTGALVREAAWIASSTCEAR
jgi:hypothetical protein